MSGKRVGRMACMYEDTQLQRNQMQNSLNWKNLQFLDNLSSSRLFQIGFHFYIRNY